MLFTSRSHNGDSYSTGESQLVHESLDLPGVFRSAVPAEASPGDQDVDVDKQHVHDGHGGVTVPDTHERERGAHAGDT